MQSNQGHIHLSQTCLSSCQQARRTDAVFFSSSTSKLSYKFPKHKIILNQRSYWIFGSRKKEKNRSAAKTERNRRPIPATLVHAPCSSERCARTKRKNWHGTQRETERRRERKPDLRLKKIDIASHLQSLSHTPHFLRFTSKNLIATLLDPFYRVPTNQRSRQDNTNTPRRTPMMKKKRFKAEVVVSWFEFLSRRNQGQMAGAENVQKTATTRSSKSTNLSTNGEH